MPHPPEVYRRLAERSWAWVLTQVRSAEDGLWLPEHPAQTELPEYPFGMHSGVGGLAHVLAEIRLARDLTLTETVLAEGIGARLTQRIPLETGYDYFDGLVSTLGILVALEAPGADLVVARLLDLATADGWPPPFGGAPRCTEHFRLNDATLGTGSVLLGAIWALEHHVTGAAELADHAAGVLLAERQELPTGLTWPFVPERFVIEKRGEMPNWSHGVAGVAGTLAAAGVVLDRPDLVEAARRGAEHLVTLADTSDGGMRVPHVIPDHDDMDTYTYSWCHGPTGTSLLFAALDRAGVPAVAGRTPYDWERACLHSLRVSGIPARLAPGFWDNDGRCCGTAGAGDAVLNVWQRHGEADDLAFAVTLGDALVERAITDGDHAYWRFVEHRNADPLLPPGPGWMQGAAGIAAYLLRLSRLLEQGPDAAAVARMDTWWALPPRPERAHQSE